MRCVPPPATKGTTISMAFSGYSARTGAADNTNGSVRTRASSGVVKRERMRGLLIECASERELHSGGLAHPSRRVADEHERDDEQDHGGREEREGQPAAHEDQRVPAA